MAQSPADPKPARSWDPRLLFSYNLILEPVSPASALVLIGVRGCLTSVNVSVTAAAGGR